MKAIVISPATQSIETIDVATLADIKAVVGYDTLESDAIAPVATGSISTRNASCAHQRPVPDRQRHPRRRQGRDRRDRDSGTTLGDVVTDVDDLRRRIRYL